MSSGRPPGLELRRQAPADVELVREVVDAAFGGREVGALTVALAQRYGTTGFLAHVPTAQDEALRAARDRPKAGDAETKPAASDPVRRGDRTLVGHVGLSRGWLDAPSRLVDVLVLSPLSVVPEWQRQGIGRALVEAATEEARRQGAPLLFLEGDPAYYSRVGFSPAVPLGLTAPSVRIPEAAFQVVVLPSYEPWMTGALVYSDVFWSHDCVGLRD